MLHGRRIAVARSPLPSLFLVTVVTLVGVLAGQMLHPVAGHASGGAYSIKWAAADPAIGSGPYSPTYAKKTPSELGCPTPSGSAGRATDPLPNAVYYAPPANTAADSVSSLAPKDLALGQIVPFEMEVTVTSGANGDLRVNPYWLAKTTSGGDFGFDPSYGVYCAFVDASDRTIDPAGNAKVASFSSTIAHPGTSNEQIAGTVNLTGANAGDRFIVEIWVVLDKTIAAGVTGNVQTGITGASEPSSGDTINVGNQTVPLLQAGKFFTETADVQVTKTDSPDPVVAGGQLQYTISVKNNSAGTVANGIVVTDRLDPNTTFVSAAGAACTESSGTVTCELGPLAPGQTQQITIVTTVKPAAPTTNDPSSNAKAGYAGTTCPTGGADLCNRVGITALTPDGVTSNNNYVQLTNVTQAVVAKAPTITTTASPGGMLGSSTFDTATLSGAPPGSYTGTLTFKLYDNGNCAGSPAFTVTTAVNAGNGTYTSPSVTPTAPGTYYWVASFISTHQNALNSGSTACNDPAERVVITPLPPTPAVTTDASDGGSVGTSVHDVATLTGGLSGGYSGSLVFELFDNDSCSGSPVTTSTVSVNGDGTYTSPSYAPTAAGSYWWVARFDSTDPAVNDSPRSPCDDPAEMVVITQPPAPTPTLTTDASDGGPLGTAIHDTATLTGGPTGHYEGTITFRLFDNNTCSGAPVTTVTKSVTGGNGSYNSPSYTPTAPGTYWWVANFETASPSVQDSATTACDDPAERVTIDPPVTPRIVTDASDGGPAGTSIHDTATLTDGPSGSYSGVILFDLYANDSCSGTPVTSVVRSITGGNGTYNSPNYTPTAAGVYYWVASFHSSSPAVNDAPATACDDPAEKVIITQAPAPKADLEIVKTADKTMAEAEAGAGQELTYTFEVTNNGPDAAHDVIVRDPLPAGVTFVSADPGCSFAAGVVTCNIGTLASGASVERDVVVKLAPAPALTPSEHAWDIQKVEAFAGLAGGETRDLALACPSGYAMLDATPRVDSVDQGAGDIGSVAFLRSEADPGDDGRFVFGVRNGTTGQAQVHLFGVCVSERTTSVAGHSHGLQLSSPLTRSDTFNPGRHTTSLTCPAGTYAVAPGFEWTGGSGGQFKSESSPDGRTWSFGFQTNGPATVESSVRCLSQATTTDAGHREFLALNHVHAYPSVPPANDGSSQPYTDHRVTCADDAKGIVGTYELPHGVKQLGSTPEPKIRDFRVLNRSGSAQTVHLDLLCLGIRLGTGGERGSITNTATVAGAEEDPDPTDNTSTHVLEPGAPAPPAPTPDPDGPDGPGDAPSFSSASAGPSALSLEVRCEAAAGCEDRAKATAVAGNRRASLGAKRIDLEAGESAELTFRITRMAKRKLDRRTPRFVVIETASGTHRKLRVAD